MIGGDLGQECPTWRNWEEGEAKGEEEEVNNTNVIVYPLLIYLLRDLQYIVTILLLLSKVGGKNTILFCDKHYILW